MDEVVTAEIDLILNYESILAEKGKEICKEIDSLFLDNKKLLIEKANTYCLFCTDPKRDYIKKEIVEKCREFITNFSRYRYIVYNLSK